MTDCTAARDTSAEPPPPPPEAAPQPQVSPGASRSGPAHPPAPARRAAPYRPLLLLPAGVALLAGLDAALLLLGLPAPVTADRLPDVHGLLLVLGFVGTLVAAERAVALGRPVGYAAPALLGAGGLALLAPAPVRVGGTLLLLGTLGLLATYLPLWRRAREDAVLVQAMGAVLAVGAVLLWVGGVAGPTIVPWLVGFVVLTIAGERLDLARLAMGPDAGTQLVRLAAGVFGGVTAALLWPPVGTPLFGLAMLGLVGWLARHDIARRTVRADGFRRFAAGCLLAGYAWLAVAGAIWTVGGPALDGARYDAVVHAVFLGFTISMIMAHAPVILPAVLRRPLPYQPVLVAPAVLLHLSLVTRLWLGDGLGQRWAWQAGGVGNGLAVLLFAALAARAVLRPGSAR